MGKQQREISAYLYDSLFVGKRGFGYSEMCDALDLDKRKCSSNIRKRMTDTERREVLMVCLNGDGKKVRVSVPPARFGWYRQVE